MTVIDKKINVYTGLKAKVLDDDQDMNELIKRVFEMNGLPNVEFYTDSEVFVRSLHQNVHLCIVDEKIKGSILQGVDVMEILRGRYPEIQIIFYSGTDDPDILRKIIRLRPEGYVYKNDPNHLNELVKEVEKCLVSIRHNMEFVQQAEKFIKR